MIELASSPCFESVFGQEEQYLNKRLLMPILDRKNGVLAVLQMANRPEDPAFTGALTQHPVQHEADIRLALYRTFNNSPARVRLARAADSSPFGETIH